MRLLRVALASVNVTTGDVRRNTDKALRQAHKAAHEGASLCALQEQVIGGYPPEDLIQWPAFVEAQQRELRRFAAETAELATVFAIGVTAPYQSQLFNCVAVVQRGIVHGLVPKEKLPTYGIFYEARTFARGWAGLDVLSDHGLPLGDLIFEFDFGNVAFEVCEDIWTPDGPLRRRAYAGAELVVNISASPFRVGVLETRRNMLRARSADSQVAIVYANAVGGMDSLVFDGGGLVVQNGNVELEAPRFEQGLWSTIIDLDRTARLRRENSTFRSDWEEWQQAAEAGRVTAPRRIRVEGSTGERADLPYPIPASRSFFMPSAAPQRDAREEFCEELLDAIALGLGDYYEKTGAFDCIGVSLSGGRDSLLTLMLAARYAARSGQAAGELLRAFTMPSTFTSDGTLDAAHAICKALGVPLAVIPIHEACERELEVAATMLDGAKPDRITRQNVQARVRAQRMWNWANSARALWLHSGNMSEKAVGYTTVGGDLEGGFSVISNVPKTVVSTLLEYMAEHAEPAVAAAIRATLATVAGPELERDQAGEEELMPFEVLDACFFLHAEEKLSLPEIARVLVQMFPEHGQEQLERWCERFDALFDRAIFKWVQAPLAVHVGSLDLDRERALQLPVVMRRADWES